VSAQLKVSVNVPNLPCRCDKGTREGDRATQDSLQSFDDYDAAKIEMRIALLSSYKFLAG